MDTPNRYKYGLRNRPASYGNVPDGWITTEADTRFNYGVVIYDAPLSESQLYDYELVPADPIKSTFNIGDQVRILKWYVFGLDRYMQKARTNQSIGTVTFITDDKVEVEFPEGLDCFSPEALTIVESKSVKGSSMDINDRLTALALKQRAAQQRIEVATAMKMKFYDLFVKPYIDEIDAIQADLEMEEQQIRDELKQYYLETGDKKPHDLVSIRNKQRWAYDKDAALKTAIERNLDFCIRRSLDVRAFEKWLDDHDWSGAEKINAPEVVMGKLGSLAIHADAQSSVQEIEE